jgi:hypothetical protein
LKQIISADYKVHVYSKVGTGQMATVLKDAA